MCVCVCVVGNTGSVVALRWNGFCCFVLLTSCCFVCFVLTRPCRGSRSPLPLPFFLSLARTSCQSHRRLVILRISPHRLLALSRILLYCTIPPRILFALTSLAIHPPIHPSKLVVTRTRSPCHHPHPHPHPTVHHWHDPFLLLYRLSYQLGIYHIDIRPRKQASTLLSPSALFFF